jgi:hypothetical protein
MINENGYWNGETAHEHHVHSPELSAWICDFLKGHEHHQLYDMGCGLGNYLLDLSNNGFKRLKGFEGSIPKERVFKLITEQDLTKPFQMYEQGNVISLEVGEHIPKELMSIYLDNIKNNCNKYLIMSWAVVGQKGYGHVNCMDNDDVIIEVTKRGFEYLAKESEEARQVVTDNTWWFKKTILIFKIK